MSARSYGNAPIIQRSKDLIERFRFPWHEAPGEAEAECARLQQAGIVDAVMSNDVDALMFGSTFTIMNFSKESGTGTSASTHVTCYHMGDEAHVSNVPLNRAGMILFAMLSGGDYLPTGVPKCGSKLAAEIAKAGFGEDLLEEIRLRLPNLDSRLHEWRDRLQYELEENESGYFATRHKAVRVPNDFPDRTILQYYAEPKVSTTDEMAALRRHLKRAWDRDIDPLAIRSFAAEHFEWNYRSGARKVIKLLAEPLVSYRLRLQRPVSRLQDGSLAPDCDTPWLQKVYRSRANFGTDGITELQMDMLPIDVVGLDLLAEEPNPPLPSQEVIPSQNTLHSGDEGDDPEVTTEAAPPTPSKSRVTRRYDPFAIEKVWVFETVARLGVPEVVNKWDKEQAAKANKAAPKKPSNRRTGPKKKGPIDAGMKRGSILKYGTLTKEKSHLSSPTKTHLLEAATSTMPAKGHVSPSRSASSYPEYIDLEADSFSPSMYSQLHASDQMSHASREVDELIGTFSLCTMSPTPRIKRHPMANQSRVRARAGILTTGEVEIDEPISLMGETVAAPQSTLSEGIKMSYSISDHGPPADSVTEETKELAKKNRHSPRKSHQTPRAVNVSNEVEELEEAIGSLSLSLEQNGGFHGPASARSVCPSVSLEQEVDGPHAPPRAQKSSPTVSPEKDLPSHDLSLSTTGLAISLEQHCNDHSTPLSRISSKKTGKDSNGEPRASRQTKSTESGQRQTKGHLENIVTYNGFWTIESPAESETASAESDACRSTVENGTGHGQKSQSKKKRVPRVSILDLV